MKIVKAIYEKGCFILPEEYEYPEKIDVVIIFPELEERIPTINSEKLKNLIALMSLGGDALEDSVKF